AGGLATDCALGRRSQEEMARLAIRYGEIEDLLPLSPLQQGLLFHALYDEGPDVYTLQLVLDLEGELDEASLAAAARGVVQRHASLRATFPHEGLSQAVQVIVPSGEVALRSVA